MVLPASATDRVLIKGAQTRYGLPGIKDPGFRSGNRFHKVASQRGDSAHALQKVQDDALAGEQHPRIVADDGNRLTLVQTDSVENFRMCGDFVVGSDRPIER